VGIKTYVHVTVGLLSPH